MSLTDSTKEEKRRKIAERKESFADWQHQRRKETLELMRRRHAYYTKLITYAGIKTAEEFYERYKEQFLMYGIELKLSDNKKWCSIHFEPGDYDYEDYSVGDGKNDALAEVSPEVSFKDMFNNVTVNIFTGEEL